MPETTDQVLRRLGIEQFSEGPVPSDVGTVHGIRPVACSGDFVRAGDAAEALRGLEAKVVQLRAERDDAREIADENATWIGVRCDKCGHRFRFRASSCPQCGNGVCSPWSAPEVYPEECDCERCMEARQQAREASNG